MPYLHLEHFNEEDQEFAKRVARLPGYFLTKFLDLNQQQIVQSFHPETIFFGGYKNAEMKRAMSYDGDFNITVFKLKYDKRYKDINHRNILGSVLALGIEKENIGDIVVRDETYLVVASEIKDYIQMNLKVNNLDVELETVHIEDMEFFPELTEKKVFTQSLRLDNIVSNVYNMSRNESKTLIQKGFVRINHRLIENPSYEVKEKDLISVRKKGRFVVLEFIGTSRKDKNILNIGIY